MKLNTPITPENFESIAVYQYGPFPSFEEVILKKLGRAEGLAGILSAFGQTSASAGYNPLSADELTATAATISEEIHAAVQLLEAWIQQEKQRTNLPKAGEN